VNGKSAEFLWFWLQCNGVQEVSQCTERPPTLFPTCFVAKMVTKHGMGLNKQSRSVVSRHFLMSILDVIACLQYFINSDQRFLPCSAHKQCVYPVLRRSVFLHLKYLTVSIRKNKLQLSHSCDLLLHTWMSDLETILTLFCVAQAFY